MTLIACVSCSLKVQMLSALAFLCLTWLAPCVQPMGGEAEAMYPTSWVNCLPQMDTGSKLNQL